MDGLKGIYFNTMKAAKVLEFGFFLFCYIFFKLDQLSRFQLIRCWFVHFFQHA